MFSEGGELSEETGLHSVEEPVESFEFSSEFGSGLSGHSVSGSELQLHKGSSFFFFFTVFFSIFLRGRNHQGLQTRLSFRETKLSLYFLSRGRIFAVHDILTFDGLHISEQVLKQSNHFNLFGEKSTSLERPHHLRGVTELHFNRESFLITSSGLQGLHEIVRP